MPEDDESEVQDRPTVPPVTPPDVSEFPPRPPQAVAVIIPSRNGAALVGYYLGVFSLIPGLGLVFALPSIVLGVIGLVQGIRHSERRGKVHAIVAIVLGLIGSYNYVGLYLLVFGTWLTAPPQNNPPVPGSFPYWG